MSTPKHCFWRVRKKWPDDMYSCCEFTWPKPVSAEQVRSHPGVTEWVGDMCVIDEIYSPLPTTNPSIPSQ